MRLATLLCVLAAVTTTTAAAGVDAPPFPNSQYPTWLVDGRIRFASNLDAVSRNDFSLVPYVVDADGSDLHPASDLESRIPLAAPPPGLSVGLPQGVSVAVSITDPAGTTRRVVTGAYATAGAALSPDGRTLVFASWVGWVYDDGAALYAVPVDGSAEPRRLTPDPCTLSSSTHSALRGRCIDGTDGADALVGTRYGDIVVAGSGDDVIRAGDGQNIVYGQWGNDEITTGAGFDAGWGGAGNDVIHSGAGSVINPGPGRDTVDAGRGADHVIANDGERDVIDCGPGTDSVRVDRIDVVRNCDHVTVRAAAVDEGLPSPTGG